MFAETILSYLLTQPIRMSPKLVNLVPHSAKTVCQDRTGKEFVPSAMISSLWLTMVPNVCWIEPVPLGAGSMIPSCHANLARATAWLASKATAMAPLSARVAPQIWLWITRLRCAWTSVTAWESISTQLLAAVPNVPIALILTKPCSVAHPARKTVRTAASLWTQISPTSASKNVSLAGMILSTTNKERDAEQIVIKPPSLISR